MEENMRIVSGGGNSHEGFLDDLIDSCIFAFHQEVILNPEGQSIHERRDNDDDHDEFEGREGLHPPQEQFRNPAEGLV